MVYKIRYLVIKLKKLIRFDMDVNPWYFQEIQIISNFYTFIELKATERNTCDMHFSKNDEVGNLMNEKYD